MKAGCFEAGDFKNKALSLIAHLDAQSGYGTYSTQVATELISRGYDLKIHAPTWRAASNELPNQVRSKIVPAYKVSGGALIIWPCVIQPANLDVFSRSMAYMTMWESTRLDSVRYRGAVERLNKCRVVIVPCAWNASIFSANGVSTPIRLAPLCVDTRTFAATENKLNSALIFGTAGRLSGGGIRKGINTVVEAFQMAFPNEKNVRLRVKHFPDDPKIQTHGDSRIDVIARYFSLAELRDWYYGLNVYVSGSASEGWGRHQQEAMCCGRPVIGINFGGVAEFFNESNGYPCDWHLVPAEGVYAGMGHYARPDTHSMAAKMQATFNDLRTLIQKSKLSSDSAHRFTIQKSVDGIVDALTEFGILQN